MLPTAVIPNQKVTITKNSSPVQRSPFSMGRCQAHQLPRVSREAALEGGSPERTQEHRMGAHQKNSFSDPVSDSE